METPILDGPAPGPDPYLGLWAGGLVPDPNPGLWAWGRGRTGILDYELGAGAGPEYWINEIITIAYWIGYCIAPAPTNQCNRT